MFKKKTEWEVNGFNICHKMITNHYLTGRLTEQTYLLDYF